MNKNTQVRLLLLIFSIVGLVASLVWFSHNSNKLLDKYEIEFAITQKIEENNINAQKSFGSLVKQKIEIKKIKILNCEETETMTCNAHIDLATFRGQESQEIKVKLENNQGKWQVVQLSKL